MDKEIATKWCEALRSGKYTQGMGDIAVHGQDVTRYCCIGVLGFHVLDLKSGNLFNFKEDEEFSKSHPGNYPAVQAKSGLTDEQLRQLVNMNDNLAKSFDQIADHIEQNLLT